MGLPPRSRVMSTPTARREIPAIVHAIAMPTREHGGSKRSSGRGREVDHRACLMRTRSSTTVKTGGGVDLLNDGGTRGRNDDLVHWGGGDLNREICEIRVCLRLTAHNRGDGGTCGLCRGS